MWWELTVSLATEPYGRLTYYRIYSPSMARYYNRLYCCRMVLVWYSAFVSGLVTEQCYGVNVFNDLAFTTRRGTCFVWFNLRGCVTQWVARLTRNVEIVGSSPITGPCCFIEQYILPFLLSPVWIQERILAWYHNRTKLNWGPYGRLTYQISPLVKYRQNENQKFNKRTYLFKARPLSNSNLEAIGLPQTKIMFTFMLVFLDI